MLVRALFAALISLATIAGTVGAAPLTLNDTPDTAIVVSASNNVQGDHIVGSTGGTFRFYKFTYSGSDAPVSINMSWTPGWDQTVQYFGFKVYGPNGLVGDGFRGNDIVPGVISTAYMNLSATAPGEYLLQVYDYTAGAAHDYSITFGGLGPGAAPVEDNSTPEQAKAVAQQASTFGGTIAGKSGGAYAYFNVDYPGGNWVMKVSVSFNPATRLPNKSIGINLYQDDKLVAQGSEVSRNWDADSVVIEASYSAVAPGPITVQVNNYEDGVVANYVVGISGLGPTPVAVSGNNTGDKSIRLTPQQSSAKGTIRGDSAGGFANFWFDYQGENKPINIIVRFKPGRFVVSNSVGVVLYRGSDVVGKSNLDDGRTIDEGVAYFGWNSDVAGPHGIQIYNYANNVTIEYTIYVMGLVR